MERFNNYVLNDMILPSEECLLRLLEQYPWFTSARVVMSRVSGQIDPQLRMKMLSSCPMQFLEKIDSEEFWQRSTDDIIDTFLSKGEHKIVPNDELAELEPQGAESGFEPSEDIISEELAEIYLKQGLNEQAKDIYSRLSLLYPKKSVYFAEIMGKIKSRD